MSRAMPSIIPSPRDGPFLNSVNVPSTLSTLTHIQTIQKARLSTHALYRCRASAFITHNFINPLSTLNAMAINRFSVDLSYIQGRCCRNIRFREFDIRLLCLPLSHADSQCYIREIRANTCSQTTEKHTLFYEHDTKRKEQQIDTRLKMEQNFSSIGWCSSDYAHRNRLDIGHSRRFRANWISKNLLYP